MSWNIINFLKNGLEGNLKKIPFKYRNLYLMVEWYVEVWDRSRAYIVKKSVGANSSYSFCIHPSRIKNLYMYYIDWMNERGRQTENNNTFFFTLTTDAYTPVFGHRSVRAHLYHIDRLTRSIKEKKTNFCKKKLLIEQN